MRRATTAMMVALAILLAPHTAWAGIAIEGLYGFARPPEANFRAAVSGAANDDDLSESSLQIAGATLLLNLGALELGAIIDKTFGDGVTQTALGGLVGLHLGDKLRLDLLGEAGGHRFGDVTDDPSVVTGSSADEWLFYVGLRPGLAYRIDLSPGVGFLVGIWGFVRWDVTDKTVPVTVRGATGLAPGDVELGGTSIGATLRAGIEFL
jgi:hypothetical protein